MGKKKGKGLITKGRYELKFRGTECLNCGQLLDISDKYCPNCSQANSTKKIVLKDFIDEFFSSLINYDSKLLKTLYTLLTKPGTITKDYINGKRVSYTNPFRFLLSLAFLYLLMATYNNAFSSLDELNLKEKIEKTGPLSYRIRSNDFENNSYSAEKQADKSLEYLDSLENLNGIPILKNVDTLRKTIQDEVRKEARKEALKDSFMLASPKKYFAELQKKDGLHLGSKMEFFFIFIQRDSIKTFEEAQEKYGAHKTWKNKLAFNSSKSTLRVIAQPGRWLSDTMTKLPFVVFLFLPLFTVFIFVAYIRKNYTYTDHLVFSFHNQSLLFILLIISWIIDSFFGVNSVGIFLLIFGIYLYMAMRRFYGQGWFKTIIKYFFLNTVFVFLAMIIVALIFTGSVFTY
jgi:hypothetical protein